MRLVVDPKAGSLLYWFDKNSRSDTDPRYNFRLIANKGNFLSLFPEYLIFDVIYMDLSFYLSIFLSMFLSLNYLSF